MLRSPRPDNGNTISSQPGSPFPDQTLLTPDISDAFCLHYNNEQTKGATLGKFFLNQTASDISVDVTDNEETRHGLTGQKNVEIKRPSRLTPKFHKFSKLKYEDSAEFSQKSENKSLGQESEKKGLRLLTIIVKDIVMTRKYTTYKEVAEIILDDVNPDKPLDSSQAVVTPEEQNIKRRVYDALNVLIAAGVLIKEGRYVRKNRSNKLIKVNKLELKLVCL